jgi:hypothetical protein
MITIQLDFTKLCTRFFGNDPKQTQNKLSFKMKQFEQTNKSNMELFNIVFD